MKRRRFLRKSSGAISLALLLDWMNQRQGVPAQEPGEARLPANLERLLAELEKTQHLYYNVPRLDGQFLNLLVKVARARRVLEIGTANGYSGIWLSLGLEETDGRLSTIEISPELVRTAKENLRRAGLTRRVDFFEGDAHQVVTKVDGPFDLVFIDAELGGKMDYFQKIYPAKLPRGGLLVVHNAIRYRAAMQDYLDFIKQHRDFDTVILSLTMEDGFAMSYRRRG